MNQMTYQMNPQIIHKIQWAGLAIMLWLCAGVALAQDGGNADEMGWQGSGEFGLVNTTGNTKTTALNLKLAFTRQSEKWRHRFGATALTTSKDGDKDNERYSAEIQSDRKFGQSSYVFGSGRWDSDKFGAYDPQVTLTAGYGRELMKSEKHMLKGEIGAGYRRLEERVSGDSSSEAIGRFLLDDSWQVFTTSTWTNRLLVEAGADNTFTQFNSGLAVAMTDRFAIKLGFEVRNNSKVAPGTKKTDTTTTANLVYNF